ncbi:GDP-L-fucose synthase [Flavobacterium amniphilum]|uniref:GDP-L-fucose synthase family protein n=1 Tax=Flavobacterium amniphilum TaxID=1834035 RepID=UPI00202AA36C|nr:GDP-L-fucose synthase [Flavobacterium amniphilum]MCL9805115.1 GDP-L-fucose synthase [Flavobacterium amniphilum]
MKILITGSNGMVGKNILEHPKAIFHDFLTPSSSELNLTDFLQVDNYIKKNQPDCIIHAAGLVGGIQANIARPVDFLVTNVDMGRNILMAAKDNNVKNFMNMASSCMYPRHAQNPLKEEMILQGELEPTNEGYALAKIFSTRLCEYINKENPEFQYKTVIPCNLYGKYDKFKPEHSHMVPAVIKKIYEAKQNNSPEIDIWGDGLARREFMYAGDLADFVFYALDNFKSMPQNINVGLGYDYTINEYYEAIAGILDFKGKFIHDLTKPVGMKQKLIDDSKLKSFGWKHQTSLEDGIKKTVEYFKSAVLND